MSVYTDIKKLIERTNKEHMTSFMNYIQKEAPEDFSTKLRSYMATYSSRTTAPEVIRKCQYVIKRGANSGKPCSSTIKEVDDIPLCTKHRKNNPQIVLPAPEPLSEEDEIIEDVVVSDAEEEPIECWTEEEHDFEN